jgi:hypothetical protein
MTKLEIVEKLLDEGHITQSEVFILLKEEDDKITTNTISIFDAEYVPLEYNPYTTTITI